MDESTSYKYQPLRSKSNDIRLLTLLPDVPGTDINCRLEIISLDDQPQYEALSYVWGSSAVRKKVYIKGKEALVTTNLETALQHLRHPERKRFLWIDALCINQQNAPEKSWQVQLMGEIYRKASSVLIWLGTKDLSTDLAFDLLEQILQNQTSIENASSQQWNGLEKIFLRTEWWTRLWVVQEFIFAPTVHLLCGNRCIPWSIIPTLLPHLLPGDRIGTRPENPRLMKIFKQALGLHMVKLADGLRVAQPRQPLVRLENFIETLSTKRRCSDPRDVIYALLGLVTLEGEVEGGIVPDYARGVGEVYLDFTRLMLRGREGRLDLLCNTYFAYTESDGCDPVDTSGLSTGGGWPSWSVDWSRSRKVESLINYYPPNSRVFYNADGGVRVGDEIFDDDTPGALILNGVVLDTIISISTSFHDLQDWQSVVRKWIPCPLLDLEKNLYVHSKEDMLSAYLRTLLRDVERHSFGMPKGRLSDEQVLSYRKHFKYWLEHPENDEQFDEEWKPNADSDIVGSREFEYFLACSLVNWCLVYTEKGYVGLVEDLVKVGDRVVVVDGACTPLVVRGMRGGEIGDRDGDGDEESGGKGFNRFSAGFLEVQLNSRKI
ncbi:hypothetical protein ACMFMF_009742 [Clarireedia jacksonii]